VFPCLNCFSATNCSSCNNTNGTLYLYAPEGQCTSSCFGLINTIIVGSNCLQCTSGCLNCSGSQSTCTSCIEGYFFIRSNSTCTITCSAPNIAYLGVCDLCLSPCASCNSTNSSNPSKPGNITICTACISGYYLYSNGCYSICPNSTYANSSTRCSSCSISCALCSITASNCTGCYN
jgi:proprotein convertase subtilisin/kexin type 5